MRRAIAAALLAATTLTAPALAAPPPAKGMVKGWAATSFYLPTVAGKTVVPDDFLTRWTNDGYAHFPRDYLYPWPGEGVPLFSAVILESGLLWVPNPGRYRIRSTVSFTFDDPDRPKPECVQRLAVNGATTLSADAVGFDGKPEKGKSTQIRSGVSKTIEVDRAGFVRIDHLYGCPLKDAEQELALLSTDLAVDKGARKKLAANAMSHEGGARFRRYPERFMTEWQTGVFFGLDLVDEDERTVPIDANNVFHPPGVAPDSNATSHSPEPLLASPALWLGTLSNKRNGEALHVDELAGHAPDIGRLMGMADMPKVAVSFRTRFAGTRPERVGLAFGLRQDRDQLFARRCALEVTAASRDGRTGTVLKQTMTSQRIGATWAVSFVTLEPGDVIEAKPDCDVDDVMTVQRLDRSNLVRGESLALVTAIRREGEMNFRVPTVNDLALPHE